jgi:hypothetical protein
MKWESYLELSQERGKEHFPHLPSERKRALSEKEGYPQQIRSPFYWPTEDHVTSMHQ